MKKIILMSCLLATPIANHSFAACNSGTMVDGRICVSKEGTVLHGMNWWSAYSWCEAQGMKMPSIYDLCPTWDGSYSENQCQTNGVGAEFWTSTAYGKTNSFIYNDNTGRISAIGRTGHYLAACISK